MRHLARARARESLRLAAAGQMGSGFVKPADAHQWFRDQKAAAGW